MQIRHLEREPDYKPGKYVQGWHRQNSGEIKMTETLRSINVERSNTDRPLPIEDQPTIIEFPVMPASAPRDMSTQKIAAQELLPQLKTTVSSYQQNHLSHFEIYDIQRNTLELVEEVIQICLRETGAYPYCVVLEPLRYLSMLTYINAAGGCYYIRNTDIRIPYAYPYAQELAGYDVMAVCEVL